MATLQTDILLIFQPYVIVACCSLDRTQWSYIDMESFVVLPEGDWRECDVWFSGWDCQSQRIPEEAAHSPQEESVPSDSPSLCPVYSWRNLFKQYSKQSPNFYGANDISRWNTKCNSNCSHTKPAILDWLEYTDGNMNVKHIELTVLT